MTNQPEATAPDAPKSSTTTAAALSPILRASRFGLVILGTLYTVGLLIVNIDLARYGLLSVDLARAEYVMAGALWSFLMMATVAALDYCTKSCKGFAKSKKTGIAILFFAVDILSTIAIFFFALMVVSRNEVQLYDFSPRVAWVLGCIVLAPPSHCLRR